jgi:hypothetical protein
MILNKFKSPTAVLLLAVSTSPIATAATLSKFSFETNWSQNPSSDVQAYPTYSRDYRLDSVSYAGKTFSDFQFVSAAHVIQNDFDDHTGPDATGFVRQPWYIVNTGRGLNTPLDPWVNEGPISGATGATDADLVSTYANLNLNSINYNRERDVYGIFTISFPHPTDRFFIFERGKDADLHLDALDAGGNTVGHWDFLRTDGYTDTGIAIVTDTGFPGWPQTGPGQAVGSVGLRIEGGAATTLKFTINAKPDNGPDLKIFGGAAVPEPAAVSLVGVALSSLMFVGLRKRSYRGSSAPAH